MFYTDVVGVCGIYVYVIRMSQTNDLLMTLLKWKLIVDFLLLLEF